MERSVQLTLLFAGAGNEDRRYSCPRCFKMYKNKGNFKVHVTKECGQTPKLKCPYCNHKTHRKYNMNIHIRLVHNVDSNMTNDSRLRTKFGPNFYQCEKCLKIFNYKYCLISHLRKNCETSSTLVNE